MPTTTQIISDMLNKGENYKVLSAMAHSQYWALQQISFRRLGSNELIFGDVKGQYFEKFFEPSLIGYLCIESFVSLSHASLMKCKFFGWDAKSLFDIYKIAEAQISHS